MTTTSPRRGMALLLVSIVIVLVALAAYGYLYHMQSQYRLARYQLEQTEARLAAMSGIEACVSMIDQTPQAREALGNFGDNESRFAAKAITDSTQADNEEVPWRFSVVSPIARDNRSSAVGTSTASWKYGMENESAKLHIPTLLAWDSKTPGHARTALLNLPGANSELVDAFLDYCRDPSRSPKQLATPEQIAWAWSGGDWNNNYLLDPIEQQINAFRGSRATTNSISGTMQRVTRNNESENRIVAWNQLLTWESGTRNENWKGQKRIFINQQDLRSLHSELLSRWPEPWANFVILYRQYGSASNASKSSPSQQNSQGDSAIPAPDFQVPPSIPINSPLDLIDAQVSIPQKIGEPKSIRSPFLSETLQQSDYLERIIDDTTLVQQDYLEGLVDINEAPLEVLLGIPGMTSTIAERCLSSRQQTTTPDRFHPGWLLKQNICDLPTLKKLLPMITCHSDVYRVQVIGFRDEISPLYRASVLLDGRVRPAQVKHFQHWQNWGRGFPINDGIGSSSTTATSNVARIP